MEVRCCCKPNNLLGYLPHFNLGEGDRVRFIAGDEILELPIRTYFPNMPASRADDGYLALSSEETPIEKLRLVNGFVEA